METLSEVIESLRVRKVSVDPQEKPERKSWTDAKIVINSMPKDYVKEIRSHSKHVHIKNYDKVNRVSLAMGTAQDYDVELVIYEPTDGKRDAKAFYVAYNNKDNVCYQRNLL